MGAYKPMQRTVTAQVLTTAGWLSGTFHLAVHQGFSEYLAREVGYYPLTDVSWGSGTTLPFFALHHTETLVVLPDPSAALLKVAPVAPQEKTRVTCLLPGAWLSGELEHLAHTRLSDSLERMSGYAVMENVELTARGVEPVRATLALVNSQRIVGLSGQDTSPEAPAKTPVPHRVAPH